ncbi:MAG: MFS transporter [Gammaproteobacteria bacterium]|nr:MAG: MFS transporter [Gammaproteobacteria bacterium]UCH39051.1 MAG: MFS transporter [Gammaproteobacteria bacterium]
MLIDYWRFARANPRFLGFGFLLAFLSSAGQTYFIGVFGTGIQADFGLDPGSWGRIYMAGTLASALVINWSGSLIDRVDLRKFTAAVLIGLGCACLVMGSVTTPLLLVGAIFLLRQFGQGLTSHAGITSMARYFDRDRGKAIALAAMGYAFGEAMLPVAGLYASLLWGWRNTFQFVALVVLISMLFALWLLKGHGRRHAEHAAELDRQAETGTGQGGYTRRQMLSEPRFYFMLPAMIAPSMIGTALFFFPAEIADAKNWSSLWVTGNYWLYSMVSVATTIYSGILIDRFSAKRVLPFFLLPLGLALVVINLSSHEYLVWPFMLLQGVTSGIYFTGLSALWAELYGARYLGAIKSLTNAVMVFSSALGPALVGTLLEWRISFLAITLILAGFCLFATLALIHALRMPSR